MSLFKTSPNSQNSGNHLASRGFVARKRIKFSDKIHRILGRTFNQNHPSFDDRLASAQVFERDQVLETPQNIGITFDHKFLVDPKEFW